MNTLKIAIVIVRLIGLQFVFLGLVYLTYLPERISMAGHARALAVVESSQLEIRMLIIRFVLHAVLGVALFFSALPIARLLTKDLEDDA